MTRRKRRTAAPRPLSKAAALAVAFVLLPAAPLHAQQPDRPALAVDPQAVQVADPYLEMRTGAGRGYPVFHVAEKGEHVVIELRSTDWYKVRIASGKTGWVHRSQLATTLTQAGERKTFRDIAIDDYLGRRMQLGASWGRFKAEPMLKVWGGWRFAESLSLEGTLGQVQGLFSGTDYWHFNLAAEPWSDRRLSPFASVGFGRFRNLPNTTLVGALPTDAKLADAAVGARWHITDRFVLRVDYTLYTAFVSDQRSSEFRAFTAGLAFFF